MKGECLTCKKTPRRGQLAIYSALQDGPWVVGRGLWPLPKNSIPAVGLELRPLKRQLFASLYLMTRLPRLLSSQILVPPLKYSSFPRRKVDVKF